ncbi:MAG TPA: endonuclease MutS2, partial [Phaeodactylibacter sp.]|nr:endonuclease MutS2 [Phaeodactylibacter sp.]
PANEPLPINKEKGIQVDTLEHKVKFESGLDIRGLTREEALRTLEVFVDKALLSNATHLRIIHGKGIGVLRKAVWRKLKEYNAIKSIYHPEGRDGGDGVTIVEMLE